MLRSSLQFLRGVSNVALPRGDGGDRGSVGNRPSFSPPPREIERREGQVSANCHAQSPPVVDKFYIVISNSSSVFSFSLPLLALVGHLVTQTYLLPTRAKRQTSPPCPRFRLALPSSLQVLPFTQGYDITAHQCVPGQRHALVVNRVFHGGSFVTFSEEMLGRFSPADWTKELDSLTRLKYEDKEAPFLVSFPEGISCLRWGRTSSARCSCLVVLGVLVVDALLIAVLVIFVRVGFEIDESLAFAFVLFDVCVSLFRSRLFFFVRCFVTFFYCTARGGSGGRESSFVFCCF